MQAATLRSELGGTWTLRPLHASSFCNTACATDGASNLFVKSASGPAGAMLAAEADGLRALAATGSLRVPAVILLHRQGDAVLLALEWLAFAPADSGFGARFGAALGALHAAPPPLQRYGWPRDNFIGATPQPNQPTDDWLDFVADQRLRPLARRLDAEIERATQAVIDLLPALFDDGHVPRPSLIHGDLWSGNWGMLADGTPVVYDPAVSVSDAEAELAMLELFGSMPAGFREAYAATAGLHQGYSRRRALYQLYHLLNHALLFGGGYRQQALRCALGVAQRGR